MQNTSVPLGKAAENGHAETVKRLLEGGADRNYQDKVRNTEDTYTHVACHHMGWFMVCSSIPYPISVCRMVEQLSTTPPGKSMQM